MKVSCQDNWGVKSAPCTWRVGVILSLRSFPNSNLRSSQTSLLNYSKENENHPIRTFEMNSLIMSITIEVQSWVICKLKCEWHFITWRRFVFDNIPYRLQYSPGVLFFKMDFRMGFNSIELKVCCFLTDEWTYFL